MMCRPCNYFLRLYGVGLGIPSLTLPAAHSPSFMFKVPISSSFAHHAGLLY